MILMTAVLREQAEIFSCCCFFTYNLNWSFTHMLFQNLRTKKKQCRMSSMPFYMQIDEKCMPFELKNVALQYM